MGQAPFEFVGNPTPLGEATTGGGGETAPRTMDFSDAERFLLPQSRRAPPAYGRGRNRKFNSQFDSLHSLVRQSKTSEKLTFPDKKEWPMSGGMRHLPCGQAANSNVWSEFHQDL